MKPKKMLREALEHLAAAEDLCRTGECQVEFATIRAAIYGQIEKERRPKLGSQ